MLPLRKFAALAGVVAISLVPVSCGGPESTSTPQLAPASQSAAGPTTTPVPSPPPSPVFIPVPSETSTPTPTPSPTPSGPTCTQVAAGLSITEQVGQLLMVGVTSTGLTDSQADALRAVRAGAAVPLGNSELGRAQTREILGEVRDAMPRPGGVKPLIAVDQEGGLVQRLRGPGFSIIPSAANQAYQSDATLARNARTWGKELARAGVNVNLAPVADVVPADLVGVNAPIGQLRRGYGSSPKQVAAKVKAFTKGMTKAEVGTAVKHFPGLGRVRGNTDVSSDVVDRVTTRDDPALASFRAAIKAGVSMVMISSATYTKIDPDHRAAFSADVIDRMLRGDFDFDGVVISDDLSAVAVSDVAPGKRAIRFVEAGGDLVIVGDTGDARAMATALVEKTTTDDDFARRVTESAARVLTLKSRLDLVSCR